MLCTFSDLFLRVVLAYLFSAQLGSTGIWAAWPVGWIVATVLSCSCNRLKEEDN